jgi:hypothetical protein
MAADEYIAQRVDVQLAWYSSNGRRAQRKYKTLRIIEIVGARYDTEQACSLFVQCIEGLLSKENTAWSQHVGRRPRATPPVARPTPEASADTPHVSL